MFEKDFMMCGKLSECIKNVFRVKSNTSRVRITKIVAKVSKMGCPEWICKRGSLTTPTVIKGIKLARYKLTLCTIIHSQIKTNFPTEQRPNQIHKGHF